MHSYISRAFAEIVRSKLRSFDGDRVGGISERGERSDSAEEMSIGIANGIAQFGFAGILTGENVIAVGIEGSAAGTVGVKKRGREKWEAEATEKGQSVSTVVKAVVLVLTRHAVEGDGHPWGSERFQMN